MNSFGKYVFPPQIATSVTVPTIKKKNTTKMPVIWAVTYMVIYLFFRWKKRDRFCLLKSVDPYVDTVSEHQFKLKFLGFF